MDRIKHYADQSIRRACAFGFLAAGTGMVALYWDITYALKLGATVTSFMAAILLWKAYEAPTRNYRRTEVFLMMDKQHEFPEARAQQLFGNILRERYLWHATIVAIGAAVLWLLTFLITLVHGGMPPP